MQHLSVRPRTLLAALVFGAAAFLGSSDGWALPAKAGYPNPPWLPLGDGNGNLVGNVKLNMPTPRTQLSGTRDLSFTDKTNPIGTTYNLYLWLDGAAPAFAAAFSKTSNPQTFTYTATLTVNDNPYGPDPYNGAFSANRWWNWRVDVTNLSGTITGDLWRFRVPLEAPTDQSQNVSVYCKFEWEPSSISTPGAKTETIYILDTNVPSQVAQGFLNAAGTAPNGALVNKAVNLAPPAPAFYGSAYPDYREFWIHDTGYVFSGRPRLQPSTQYYWAIWYTPTAGAGHYGPVYTFTTASEAVEGFDQTVQSLIVYWQHPQGHLARDPDENVTTFAPLASQLQAIHQNDLQPTVKTLIYGTEQMAASFGGLDGGPPNLVQQPYVPDIMAFPGWYTWGGATNINGAYDTGQYGNRVSAGYPPVAGNLPALSLNRRRPTAPVRDAGPLPRVGRQGHSDLAPGRREYKLLWP